MSDLVSCQTCGKSVSASAVACPHCGASGQGAVSSKSGLIALILAFFLGALGIHNFYLGRVFRGVFQLILFGIASLLMVFLIGWLLYLPLLAWVFLEFVFILLGGARDGDGMKVKL